MNSKLAAGIMLMCAGGAFASAWNANWAFPIGLRNVLLPLNAPLPHSLNASATSGGPATACSSAPALPAGLTVALSGSTCKISGTPTASTPQAVYTISSTTSGGTSTTPETLTVTPVMNLKYTQINANYSVGTPIDDNTASITGSALDGFAVTGGSLPSGLSLNTVTGAITGTPGVVTPSAPVTITATNGAFTTSATLNIGVQAAATYLSSWAYYKSVTFTPSGLNAGVGNYPLLVKLDTGNFDFSKSLSDIFPVPAGTFYSGTGGGDIRFTRADGTTDLPYQIERWDGINHAAEIWVLVPVVSGSAPTTVKMFFGKTGQATTSNASRVFSTANNFQAVWHMNNGGGGDEVDATENGFTATAQAGPTTSTGLIGLGRSLASASAQYFSTTATSVQGFQQNGFYTVSAWVNVGAINTGTYYTVIQKHDRQFSLQINNSNPNVWESAEYNADSGGSAGRTPYGWQGVVNQNALPATQGVHYVVGQHDGYYQRLYVDGVLIYNNSNNGSSSPGSTAPTLTNAVAIGRQSEAASRWWNGDLDEVRMHSTVRDSNWVKADYQSQSPAGTSMAFGAALPTNPNAPAGLTYSSNPAVYTGGVAVAPNLPSLIQGNATSWTIAPALPAGLNFSASDGRITGTPTSAAAAANYLVTATNQFGSDTETVRITVNGVAPSSLSYSSAAYLFGNGLASTTGPATVNNGGLPIVYSSVTLPVGLHIDSATGAIFGTPTLGSASSGYLITAANAQGNTTTTLTVTVLNPISTFHYPLDSLTLGKNVIMGVDSPTVNGTVPFGPVKYSVSPALPAGVAVDSLTGVISGTPSVSLASTLFIVKVTNGVSPFDLFDTLLITVVNPPTGLTYSSNILIGEEGQAPTPDLPMPSGTAPFLPIAYAKTAGALPTGMTLNSDGSISGTPAVGSSAASPYQAVISASNPSGSIVDTLTIIVLQAESYGAWIHSQTLTLNTSADGANIGTSQTGFPLLVRLNSSHRAIFQQASPNGTDIRFTDGAGAHLPYQIERWSVDPADTSAAIWVRANSVAANGSTTLKIYWGNGSAPNRSNGGAVFNNSFVGVWHLGDTTGINPRPDAVAGAPMATPSNDAGVFGSGTYVIPAGIIGMADTIRGGGTRAAPVSTCDYLYLGTGAVTATTPWSGNNTYTGYNDFSNGFSYSVWVKAGTGLTNSYLLELANLTQDQDNIQFFRTSTASPGAVKFQNDNGTASGSGIGGTSAANGITTNVWQHFTVTATPTPGNPAVAIYRNGVSVLSTTSPQIFSNVLRTNAWIGKSNYTTDPYFRGAFDEPEISNVSRSADWVRLSYLSQKAGVAPLFNLSYASDSAVYTAHAPIALNAATLIGNATRWTSTPSLPAGLSLDSAGDIVGTPLAITPATQYVISAFSDSAWSVSATVKLAVVATAPSGLAYAKDTVSYRQNEHISDNISTLANDGGGGISFSVSPALPAGLSLNAATGTLSGVPTTAQTQTDYVVSATNASGSAKDTVSITITSGENYSLWTHSKTLTLNPASSGVTAGTRNFPLLVRLSSAHAALFAQAATAGVDIRFSEPGGVHLPYQIEHWNFAPGDTSAAIWVLVDTIPAGGATSIKIYWGNGSTTSDSRPHTVFSPGNGFEAVYHFSETVLNAGDTTSDATGNGHTASAAVSGGSVPGDSLDGIGVSKTFTGLNTSATAGTGGYFTLADSNLANTGLALNTSNGPWTISAWVKPTSCSFNTFASPFTSGRYAVLSKYSGATGGQKAYFFGGNNVNNQWKVNFIPTSLTSGNNEMSSPTNTCVAGGWQFLSASYFSTQTPLAGRAPLPTEFSVRLNGVQSGVPSAGANTSAGNGASVRIGASDDNARFMNGSIDEVVISKVQRTTDWVELSYASQAPKVMPLYDLSYSNTAPVYHVDSLIQSDTPVITGSATAFSVSPVLPAGLVLDSVTGIISGTPSVAVAAADYTVTATNGGLWYASAVVHLTVNPGAPPSALSYHQKSPVYLTGVAIFPDTADVTGIVTHYAVAPALPAGLVLDSVTGILSGTPTTASPLTNYVVTAGNSAGSAADTLHITVLGIPSGLTYVKQSPVYSVGIPIVPDTARVSGGPTHFAVSPALPAGLSLDSVTGVLSGTPAAASAKAAFAITASNTSGSTVDTLQITVLVPPSNLSYPRKTVIFGVNVAIVSDSPTVAGTVTRFSVAPSLPAGLLLDSSTGVLSGTPVTALASTNFVVTASNPAASTTDTLHITVLAAPTSLTYRQQSPEYVRNTLITPDTPSVVGTVTHYAVSPSLPAGLFLDSNSGIVSGTPSAASAKTAYAVTASNVAGFTRDTVNITVLTSTNILDPHILHVRGSSTFALHVPDIGITTIHMKVEDMMGHIVWSREYDLSKDRNIFWDGTGMNGSRIPSGIYIMRLSLPGQTLKLNIKR